MTRGTGKTHIFKAIEWGFKHTFAQPVWLAFAFVTGFYVVILLVITSVISAFLTDNRLSHDPNIADNTMLTYLSYPSFWLDSIMMPLCVAILTPLYISAALKSANGQRLEFSDFFRPRRALWTFAPVFVAYLPSKCISNLSTIAYSAQVNYGEATITTPQDTLKIFDGELVFMAVLAVVMAAFTFTSPFFILIPYAWQDTDCSFFEGITQGFALGTRNYLPLLGFSILCGSLVATAMIPLGLGMIIVFPAQILATAFLYRQVTGGIHPQT